MGALPDLGEAVGLVRHRSGVVGETRRVCHVVPFPTGETIAEDLRALCGASVRLGEIEWLPYLTGMPCERCLAVALRRASVEMPAVGS